MRRFVFFVLVLTLSLALTSTAPAQDDGGQSYTLADGTSVVIGAAGEQVITYPNGLTGILNPDGSWVVTDTSTGFTMISDANGNISYTFDKLSPEGLAFLMRLWNIHLPRYYKMTISPNGQYLTGSSEGQVDIYDGDDLMGEMDEGSVGFEGVQCNPATQALRDALGAVLATTLDAPEPYGTQLIDAATSISDQLDGGASLADVADDVAALRQILQNASEEATGTPKAYLELVLDIHGWILDSTDWDQETTCLMPSQQEIMDDLKQLNRDLADDTFDFNVGAPTISPRPVMSPSEPEFIHSFDMDGFVDDFSFSPDSSSLLIGTESGGMGVFDLGTGELDRQLFLPLDGAMLGGTARQAPTRITSVAYSPDGALMVAAAENGVFIYETGGNMTPLAVLPDNGSKWDLTFSPDGSQLAYASGNAIHVWDTTTYERVITLTGHTNTTWTLDFSPDGSRLVTGAWDSRVILWDTADWSQIAAINADTSGRLVENVRFNTDGSFFAATSYDGNLRFWDTNSAQLLHTIEGYTGQGTSLIFHPRGDLMLTAAADGTLRFWASYRGELPAPDDQPPAPTEEALPPGVPPGGDPPDVASTGCRVTAANTVNLRGGPGTTFDVVGQLNAGDRADVSGQAMGADGFVWWKLLVEAWVRSDVVTASGDCANVPTVTP